MTAARRPGTDIDCRAAVKLSASAAAPELLVTAKPAAGTRGAAADLMTRDHRPRGIQRQDRMKTAASGDQDARRAGQVPLGHPRPTWTTSLAGVDRAKRMPSVAGRTASHSGSASESCRPGRQQVRYFTAADLADTLYRGWPHSAGRVIDSLSATDLSGR